DIMKVNGHGNIQMRVGTTEDLSIAGRYEIDKGSYNFTFQSFIRKPFIFREGGDNYIQWKGNPYDADINIEAVYEAENIRFSDLAYSTTSIGAAIGKGSAVQQYRGPVMVIANLTNKLTRPDIKFQIELPQNSALRNDQDAAFLLQMIQSDQNELNKQVSFLIVFNSFGPLSNSNTTFGAGTAVSGLTNSITGILSNQISNELSNKFQKVFNNKNLRLNLNTNFYSGTNITGVVDERVIFDRTNVNLSIAQSFLNERLTFTFGSSLDFGLSTEQYQASSFQFLPDITMEYKITADGRLAVSVFYRDSYNYLSTANRTANRSGTSISYRKNFDRIDELFRKKKKEVPKEQPIPPPTPGNGSQP
ncbi:MAG TPA: translocation/assembly module TamB domain-containing protein, partial [Puia sp.]|nr:translocation/assembly module TamB domain-containing protein [Puia sp.]